jgi:hypothetical protein
MAKHHFLMELKLMAAAIICQYRQKMFHREVSKKTKADVVHQLMYDDVCAASKDVMSLARLDGPATFC